MIVITAPTSRIGSQLLLNLSDTSERLRVVARDPSRLPESIRACVEVVQGSHADPAVVDRAFAGANGVFWLVPPDPRATSVEAAYVDFSRPACRAITQHQVKRVVSISAIGRGTPWASKAGLVAASLTMDDLIKGTGVNFRALTLPSFFENILRQLPAIRTAGEFYSPLSADRKFPGCATRDIAAAASTLLLDSSWTGQAEVPVLGPEDLSGYDMAEIMSKVLGRSIRYRQVPLEAYKARLLEQGMSEGMAQGMVDMMTAKNSGLDNGERRTEQSSSPTSFAQWCEEVLKPAVLAQSSEKATL